MALIAIAFCRLSKWSKSPKVKMLGIAGSLWRGSYNRAALRAAQALVPAGAELEIFELERRSRRAMPEFRKIFASRV
jgi:hypothetical protein